MQKRAAARKPHISYSQLSMKCGEAYRRRHIEGDRLPPMVPMARGIAVHRGIAENFQQKIDSHRDLPHRQIVDASVAGFEAAISEGLLLTPDERSVGLQIVVGETTDAVRDMAEVHAIYQAPEYQPILVEQRVEIVFPNAPQNLVAVLDVATTDVVADFKTSGKKKHQSEVDHSPQLTIYDMAYEALTGHAPAAVVLDTIVQTSTKTERQKLVGHRDAADRLTLLARINQFSLMLAAGVFMPSNPAADWWCAPKWCGYWQTCPYVNPASGEPTSQNPITKRKRHVR